MATRKDNRVLSNRYELKDRLGAGGMAEVYLGRDRVLGRTIAVKTLHHQFAGDPAFIARFRREAQSAASLNHPHIVSVYDTGSHDGTHYIVMEFVDGRTLRDAIREEGPLLPERAAEIGADVCAALAYAHAHGIIHRDIKPANIMLTEGGGVKVTDFGIARAVSGDTVTQTATVLGTAQYFSPEQAQAGPVDARSDVYSLGVVLYEMLTRQVPFTGSSPVAIAYKHVKEEPILPSRLNPDIPDAIEAIVMKALAKNPDNRYQTANDLREDLLRAIHGQPVSATPVLDDRTAAVSPYTEDTVVIARRPTAPLRRERVRDPERRRRNTGVLLLTLIGLGVVGLLVWALSGALGEPATLTVPDVVGRPVLEAQDLLREQGFEPRVLASVASDVFEAGEVLAQDPEAGAKLKEGGTVRLTPSSGKGAAIVPDLKNKSEGTAKQLIEAAGLKVGEIRREFHDTVAAGRVIDQNPNAGTRLEKGDRVNLTISRGPKTAIVPDVIGLLESDARAQIENRDLKVSVVHEPSSFECNQPPGRVCRQDPPPDTEVPRDSTVTIVVAEEFLPPTESPSPTPTESPSPGPF